MSLRFALLLSVTSALVAFAIGTQFAPSRTSERLPSRPYAPAAATELAGEAAAIQAVLLEEDLLARTADLTALLQRLGPDSLEDVKDLGPLATQRLSEEELQRVANLGNNGPRSVAGLTMTHCVPNEHVAVERPDRALRFDATVGSHGPAWCTALGKMLL